MSAIAVLSLDGILDIFALVVSIFGAECFPFVARAESFLSRGISSVFVTIALESEVLLSSSPLSESDAITTFLSLVGYVNNFFK